MTKAHIFNFTVAYADSDAQGIMYHGRYIEVAERARFDWSKDIPVPDGDLGFIVHDLNIRYLHPILLGESFVVETRTAKIGAASITIEQKFVKCDKICAIMNITIAYLGSDMRPKAVPESIINALK